MFELEGKTSNIFDSAEELAKQGKAVAIRKARNEFG
ncbi:MAG: hypothetical protein ACI9R3_003558, partial [Verrucomicrobiales bacterium]